MLRELSVEGQILCLYFYRRGEERRLGVLHFRRATPVHTAARSAHYSTTKFRKMKCFTAANYEHGTALRRHKKSIAMSIMAPQRKYKLCLSLEEQKNGLEMVSNGVCVL